jgi:hypothetical protein
MAPKIVRFDAKDLSSVEYTPAEIKRALEYPSDFGYSGNNADLFKTWTLGPIIETRDSEMIAVSNAACLKASLAVAFPGDAEWGIVGCSHWAVGWVDHLSFRLVETDGITVTPVAIWIKCFFDMIADYPVADEDDFSDREYVFALESIEDTLRYSHKLRDDKDLADCAEIIREAMCEDGEDLPRENHSRDDRVLEIAADRDMLALEDCDE